MAFSLKVDLRGKKSVTEAAQQDGVKEGWHLAELVDVEESQDGHSAYLWFRVKHGECSDQKIKFVLPDPRYVARDKYKKAAERVRCVVARLGLVGEDDLDQEVDAELDDAKGTEVFIQVELQDGRDIPGIAYLGIYDLAHNPMPADFPPALNQFRTCADPQIRQARGGKGGGKARPKEKPPLAEEPDVGDLVA